eukprot:672363-Karenia_brevis.AAC.1
MPQRNSSLGHGGSGGMSGLVVIRCVGVRRFGGGPLDKRRVENLCYCNKCGHLHEHGRQCWHGPDGDP